MNFLRYYVRFETQEFSNIFEQEVKQTTGRTETMGIEEFLLDRATKLGIEQGIEKGIEKGRHEEAVEIARQLKKEGLDIEFIAKTTKLAVKDIEAL